MKVTSQILSIPPHISTTWKNISAIHTEADAEGLLLIVSLKSGAQIAIPGLDHESIDKIFEAHAQSTEAGKTSLKTFFESPLEFNLPMKSIGGLDFANSTTMQHNPEQSNAAPIHPEILKKIAMITKALGFDDTSLFTEPEPHCNCTYCQIAKAIQGKETHLEEIDEVSDDDLKFREWDITQTAEKLYTVTNPLDQNEHYNVFLGSPVGCTCGSKNCEHIRAVLSS